MNVLMGKGCTCGTYEETREETEEEIVIITNPFCYYEKQKYGLLCLSPCFGIGWDNRNRINLDNCDCQPEFIYTLCCCDNTSKIWFPNCNGCISPVLVEMSDQDGGWCVSVLGCNIYYNRINNEHVRDCCLTIVWCQCPCSYTERVDYVFEDDKDLERYINDKGYYRWKIIRNMSLLGIDYTLTKQEPPRLEMSIDDIRAERSRKLN